MSQGKNALSNSVQGTRMSLLTADPLNTAQTDRQFAFGSHSLDLLGIEREVVAQQARGLFRCDGRIPCRHTGHRRNVVEQRCDIIK